MDREIELQKLKNKGASEEEIKRFEEYLNAINSLSLLKKTLQIDELLRKYFDFVE